MKRTPLRVLLAGGGHSHVEVLRFLRAKPDPSLAVTLASPEPLAVYSGMLPGVLAGHYRLREAQIALPRLARAANAAFVPARIVALDLAERVAQLHTGARLPFDFLLLDVGSVPDASLPGAAEHTCPVRPPLKLLAAWEATLRDAVAGAVRSLAVVGGGAAGVEILLAMQHRLRSPGAEHVPRFMLVSDEPEPMAQHAPRVRRAVRQLLATRGVALHLASAVSSVERDALVVTGGERIAADRVFLATSPAAAPFLAASGLDCDPRGFVRVDATLRSTSHDFVFASGDCAAQAGVAYAKSGVIAVRHGRHLAANLSRARSGEPLRPFLAPSRGLALIGTGDREAILSYGAFAARGAWVWRLKEAIDRRHMAAVDAAPDTAD